MKKSETTPSSFMLANMSQKGTDVNGWESEKSGELHSGDLCPACKQELLDYDGLLNLTCPSCGFSVGGCFT